MNSELSSVVWAYAEDVGRSSCKSKWYSYTYITQAYPFPKDVQRFIFNVLIISDKELAIFHFTLYV